MTAPKSSSDDRASSRFFSAHLAYEDRVGRRVSQAEVASAIQKLLGRPVDQTSVGRWLRGVAMPDVRTITAVAEFYDVSPGWLAFGEGAMARLQAIPVPPYLGPVTDDATDLEEYKPKKPPTPAKKVRAEDEPAPVRKKRRA